MKSLIEYINESNNIELISDGNEHGFDYVDLGLPSGTMWATCNVGASKPEDEGLLFQFGRVDGYKYRSIKNQFRTEEQNIQDTGSAYMPLTTSGKVYNENDILDLKDDAAHVNMGGKWSMPTKDELEELYNNTSHEVITVNGVQGMMLTSKINKKQLFIPFMQYCLLNGKWLYWGRSFARIWSSNVDDSDVNSAYIFFCTESGDDGIEYDYRSLTSSIRGVFKK